MNARRNLLRVVLTYDKLLPFVQRDLHILRRHYKTSSVEYKGKRTLPKLSLSIAKSDVNFSWFVLGYATSSVLFSRILRKKSVVIAGGWDVIYLPEIGYGAMANPKRRGRTIYALQKADKVIAVSESTRREVLQWVDRDVDVIYNCVDTDFFRPKGGKEKMVVSVAGITNTVRFKKKGIGTLIQVAKRMPDTQFYIIGHNSPDWDAWMREMAPDNVVITGRVSDKELLSLYQKAAVYAQLSYHESFGVSLAEGMSCCCVPVVTNRTALPEVVGDTGFYVDYGDVPGTVEAICKALDSDKREACRKRIQERFSISSRERSLVRVVNELVSE